MTDGVLYYTEPDEAIALINFSFSQGVPILAHRIIHDVFVPRLETGAGQAIGVDAIKALILEIAKAKRGGTT